MALAGLFCSFLPEESLVLLGSEPDTPTIILVQVTGALYMGFAMLNWMARSSVIGGIYGRPLSMGNFLHFAVVAALLVMVRRRSFHSSGYASKRFRLTGIAVRSSANTTIPP